MHFNDLPEDCFRLVLSCLPLCELYRLRTSVCRQWRTIIELMFTANRRLHLFSSRAELATANRGIFEHNIDEFAFGDHVLILNQNEEGGICPETLLTLPDLFPNVCSLKFSSQTTHEELLPEMLLRWAPKLELLCIAHLPTSPTVTAQLWKIISSMSNLINFKLLCAYRNPIPEGLSVIRQLHYFRLMYYLPSLVPLLSSLDSCTHLDLNWVYLSRTQLETALKVNSSLRHRLTSLSLGFIFSPGGNGSREKNYQELFHYVCEQLPNLQMLDIMFADHLPLSVLVPELSKLLKLEKLWLYIGQAQLSDILRSSTSYDDLPQLTSVRVLRLEISDLTVEHFFALVPHLFPALEQITLRCPDFGGVNSVSQKILEEGFSEHFPTVKRQKLKFV